MLNPKLKPLFNAAYLAIFLRFARKTYRKLNPYRMRFRRRYVVSIPCMDRYIVTGSYNSLDAAVGHLHALRNSNPTLSYELIDLERMFNLFLGLDDPLSTAYINANWHGMNQAACLRTPVSIFDVNEFGNPFGFSPAQTRKFRSTSTEHHQNAKTTSMEDLVV